MKKMNNFKQFLFILFAFAFLGANQAWGYATSGSAVKQVGSTYYVLYETGESTFSTISSKEYELKGPGAQVTYDAKRVPILGVSGGDLKLAQKVDGSYGDALYSAEPPKNSYKSYGPISIDRSATHIKLYTDVGATGKKSMKNVFVTMAQYVDDASAPSIAFGSGYVNAANTNKSVTVAWCNVPAMTYSIIGANKDLFEVSVSNNASAGKWGTATFNVAYKHSVAGNHSATLVIQDTYNDYSFEVSLAGSTQKNPNTIAWAVDETSWKDWGETLTLNATASNTDYTNYPITYTSSNDEFASIADGVLTFHEAGAGQEVKVTLKQEETDAYLGATVVKTFHVLRSQTVAWDATVVNTTIRLGATRDISAYAVATPAGSRAITFTSSNPNVIEVKEDGVTIEGKAIGTAVITANLAGDNEYRAASITKEFEVKDKEDAVLTLGGIILNENDVIDIYIGENTGALASTNDASALACDIVKEDVVVFNETTHQFESKQLGTTKVTIAQDGNDDYPAINRTITINVVRYQTTITTSLESATLFVGENADVTFESNRTDEEVAVASSNEAVAKYEDGKILAVGEGTANIIFSNSETDTWSAGEKKVFVTVNRRTPSLSMKLNGVAQTSISIYQGESVPVTFEKVSDAEVVVEQIGGEAFASYANGTIKASNELGTAYFRALLPQTQEYKGTSVEFSVTVLKDARHLPITMNNSLWNNSNFKVGNSGSNSWDNSKGITLGATDGATNWEEKYVILHFEGIPDKLTFDIATEATGAGSFFGGATRVAWYIQESTSQTMNGAKIWTQSADGTDYTSYSVQLDPSTRYIKLCYSGNFGGHFRNLKISELKYVQDPQPASLDFGEATINSSELTKEISINWCNIAPMTVTSTNPRIVVTPNMFGEYDQMGMQTLMVSYNPGNVVEVNEGDILISNGNELFEKTIHVKAATIKRPQTVTWNTELMATNFAMNVGEQYPNNAITTIATTPNGERITYSSDAPEIIEVIADTALVAKAAGTANITAYQAGDDEYQEVSDTKPFVVTMLQKQTISWAQNLYGLLTTSAPVELTASATSNMTITYTSNNENVVRVEGNMLIVVGEGEATITATQEGGVDENEVEWLRVTQDNYVIVRNPASQCGEMALAEGSLTLNNVNSFTKVYDLVGVPTTLTFVAKHGEKPNGDWGQKPTYAALMVDEYAIVDGVRKWHNIYNTVVGTSNTNSGSIALMESATQVRFRTTETGTDHTISKIEIPRSKFLRSDVEGFDENVESNTIWEKTITISHSNFDMLSVVATQGILTVSTNTLGTGCGSFGDDQFTVTFTPMQKYVDYYDTLVISDGKADPSVIPVHLYSKGLNQGIEGFEVPETVKATDVVAPFTATASSLLPVTYSTSDPSIARIVNDNQLEILGVGTIQVIAMQVGDAKYDSTAVERTLVITPATPVISETAVEGEITYGDNLTELVVSGAADVDGYFEWKDSTLILPGAGEQKAIAIFNPADARYQNVEVEVTVNVKKAKLTITANDTTIEVGSPVPQFSATFEGFVNGDGVALVEEDLQFRTTYSESSPKGEYRIIPYGPSPDNYKIILRPGKLYVVNAIAHLTEVPTAKTDLIYTGQPQELINAGVADHGQLEYRLGENGEWSTEIPTATNAGDYTVYYQVQDGEDYTGIDPVAITATITFKAEEGKEPQTITWNDEFYTLKPGESFALWAEASSGEDVTFTSSDPTIAYIEDNMAVVAVKGGTVTITAHQAGNETYSMAQPISKELVVKDVATAVDNSAAAAQAKKLIRNNQVLIIREGRIYTATGLLVE